MNWKESRVADDKTHHVDSTGGPLYNDRFDHVLKFHAPGLAPVSRGKEAWHISTTGAAAYRRRFGASFGFYEGLAAVAALEGWWHITPSGDDAYAARFDWCGNFQEGLCTVRYKGERYQHILPDGRPAYTQTWRYAGDFRDGIAVVQHDDGRSTHIRADGTFVHGRWFNDLDVFHKGYARARDEHGWHHIDESGRALYARRFAMVEPFYNGQARVEHADGTRHVMDEYGIAMATPRGPQVDDFAALSADMVGYWRTMTIAAAVELGIFEALPGPVTQLADRLQLDLDGTKRLLRALHELELVTPLSDFWAATDRGALLRADHPTTLRYAACEWATRFVEMWRPLAESFRSGSQWTRPSIFDAIATAGAVSTHHTTLQSYAAHDYRELAPLLGIRAGELVADAGGGLGELARVVVAGSPDARVVVLERPEVCAAAIERGLATGAVTWATQDLFEPWTLAPDAVLLARVLHDWDDADALTILRRARAALRPGGRVLVVEMVMDPVLPSGALCDLHLRMATGGRERTVAQFDALLKEAGFELVSVQRSPGLVTVLMGEAT